MRGSLNRIRARVERLARQARDGCTVCRGDEAKPRLHWQDSPRSVDDELDALPQMKTCAACGRTYALQYTVVRWLTDDVVGGPPPAASLGR